MSSSAGPATASWARIGPSSTSSVATWTVQPVTLTPAASASSHRVPALERRQQRRVGVEDPAAELVVDRLLEDRHEAGHGDEVDVVALAARRPPGGCRRPGRSRAPKLRALDELDRDAGGRRPSGRAARPVDHHDLDGEPAVEHRLEDRPAPDASTPSLRTRRTLPTSSGEVGRPRPGTLNVGKSPDDHSGREMLELGPTPWSDASGARPAVAPPEVVRRQLSWI